VETKVELQATSEVHKGENSKQTLEWDKRRKKTVEWNT